MAIEEVMSVDHVISWHAGAEGARLALEGEKRGHSTAGSCPWAPTEVMGLAW